MRDSRLLVVVVAIAPTTAGQLTRGETLAHSERHVPKPVNPQPARPHARIRRERDEDSGLTSD